jgi:DHA1 family bicyclomycin/chloramphenicol resistance-like MFS transporter
MWYFDSDNIYHFSRSKESLITRSKYILFVVLIAGISSLNPVAIDTFLPAMPAIAISLAVDPGTLGITLGIYTVGAGFGQIIFGPVSDRFGRKPLVVFGLSLYVFAAIFAFYTTSIEGLSIVRFIQGVGAASGRIIGVAVVRDLYAREKAARLLSNIWTVSTMMPIINPFIGSTLVHYFQWNSVFLFMAIFAGIMVLLTLFFFKETLKHKNLDALNPKQLFQNFLQISINRAFLAYMLISSVTMSSLYGFLATSSDLLITQLNQHPTTFAWQFAVVGVGSLTGSIISARLSIKFGINRVIKLGILITAVSSLTFFLLSLNEFFTPIAIIAPFTIQRIGEAMISTQSISGAISPFPERAGSASSLLGFFRQMTGAAVAILVGYYADGTSLPMAVAFLFAGLMPAVIYIYFRKEIR